MRDIIVSLAILGILPICFKKPFVGLLVFSLLAYMRVQDLTWGFARGMRWSFYVAIVTFAGFFFSSRERKFMVDDLRCHLMIVLTVLVGMSLVMAGNLRPRDFGNYVEYIKIIVIALFTTGMVQTRERLRLMVWVIALSFGFFGFKAGLLGILTGGGLVILEGPGGMLQDNNDFALAMAMSIPMLWYIGYSEKRPVLRRLFHMIVPLSMITVGLTHSRGGFLAMCSGLGILTWRSRNRVAAIVLAVFVVGGGLLAAPDAIVERLQSIRNYKEDASAMSRIAAWRTGAEMIKANPVFGVGFERFQQNYVRYDPAREDVTLAFHGSHVAHNSYIQIWAECGTPAFLVYLALLYLTFADLARVRREARRRYHASWILDYAAMFEATLATFVVGSVFLSRAHFDLLYHWQALVIAFGRIARAEMADLGKYPVHSQGAGRGPLAPVRRPGFRTPVPQPGRG